MAELGPERWLAAELQRPAPPPGAPLPTPAAERPRSQEARMEMRRAGRDIVAALAARRLEHQVDGGYPLHDAALDFWSNHFAIYARKGLAEPILLPDW